MKKKLLALFLALAFVFTATACNTANSDNGNSNSGDGNSNDTGVADGETVKIGYIASLTASGAYTDIPPMYAMQDYIEEINANGGLLGHQVELVTYDNTRDPPTESVTAANKLIQDDKVIAILGPTSSRATLPVVTICNENKTPCITISATNEKITVNENTGEVEPYMFRVCMIDSYQGTALADFARNDLGIEKVAVIASIDDPYAQGITGFFNSRFEELGGQIVEQLGVQSREVEYRAQLAKASEAGAEAILFPATEYRDVALMAQQAEELGLEFTYLFGDGVYANELLEAAGPQLEGAYISVGCTDDDPAFADYRAAFNEKHGDSGYTCNIYAYYAMDAIMLLEWAVNQAGSFDGEKIAAALETATDVPLFTENMTIEPDTHNPHNKTLSIVQITDSQYTLYKTFKPQD